MIARFLFLASFVMASSAVTFSCLNFQDDTCYSDPAQPSPSPCVETSELSLLPTQSCFYQMQNAAQRNLREDVTRLLPDELLFQVVSTLSAPDLMQMAATCYRLAQLLQDDTVWQPFIRDICYDFEPRVMSGKRAREIYKIHTLKVWATSLEDSSLMAAFIQKHHLFQFPTFFLSRYFFNHRYFTHFDHKKFTALIGAQERVRIEYQLRTSPGSPVLPACEMERSIIHRQIDGLIRGEYGYQKDLALAHALIELRCEQGDQCALDLKLKGFIYGFYGYTKTLKETHDLIEQWSNRGHALAIKAKIWGLEDGCYGYTKNLKQLRHFIDYWSAQGCSVAFKRKISGLLYALYGYGQNSEEAHRLIDAGIAQGQAPALRLKLDGLTLGEYGYTESLAAIRRFIDHWSMQGDAEAMYRKMEGFLYGDYGYAQDLQAVHDLIEQWSAQGYSAFINKKIAGLVTGNYGYPQDLEQAGHVIAALPFQEACNQIEYILYENFRFMDLSHLINFIDILHHQGQRQGTYLKAFFLKFSLNSCPETAQAAKAFILQHRIAF